MVVTSRTRLLNRTYASAFNIIISTMKTPDGKHETDRIQRKRIQNREAQQKYRIRMKERMSALEEQVKELKSQARTQPRGQQSTPGGSNSSSGNGNDNGVHGTGINPNPGSMINNESDSHGQTGSGPSREVAVTATSTTVQTPSKLLPPNEQPHHCLEPPLQQHTQYPPQRTFATLSSFASTPLPQPRLLTPEWSWERVPNSAYEGSIDQHQATGFPVIGTSSSDCRQVRSEQQGSGSHGIISPGDMYMVSDQDSHQLFPEPDVDILTTTFADRPSSGPPDSPDGDAASSISDMPSSYSHERKSLAEVLENYLLTSSSNEQKLPSRCLEERFEFVQLFLSSAGFSSIDAMVSQYYTADFSHESIVSSEQRSSRHSQLPLLLARLRRDVTTWTQWEAHGYQYEIIKSAESIIRAERADFNAAAQKSYINALSNLGRTHSDAVKVSLGNAFRPLTKIFQENVPKLWALTESLIGSDDALNQRQRSYTSLAVILLLCRPDQVPKQQMMAILMSCLDMVYGNSK